MEKKVAKENRSNIDEYSMSWSSGLGTSLLTRGSCVRIPLRSRLEGSQCHPPPQGGTGCGKMDDISPSPTVGPALSRPGANKKKNKLKKIIIKKKILYVPSRMNPFLPILSS